MLLAMPTEVLELLEPSAVETEVARAGEVLRQGGFLALTLCAGALAASAAVTTGTGDPELRPLIDEMKANPRGPFERIRWFCKDGTVLPPKAYACRDHGGGVQHGEWSEPTQRVRAKGFAIANVYASLDPAPLLGADADLDLLGQLLMERFLMRVDNGWIFRKARSYRGALQAEDEEAGAKALVLAMLADPTWLAAVGTHVAIPE